MSPEGFPHVLFDDIMDFLALEELLQIVMPVSRLWRALTIEHRTYWHDIRLERDRSSPGYISLFRTRISRSLDRLVNVTIRLLDPRVVLPDIAKHLSHIRELDIQTNIEHASAALSVLRVSPAPRVRSLRLCFEFLGDQRHRYATLPSDLFACHAPELANLDLWNVEFASSASVPACLARLSKLKYHCVDRGVPCSVPPELTRRLRVLSLCLPISLEDAAYQDGSTWSMLQELILDARITYPTMEEPWGLLRLPVADVPRIKHFGADAAGQYALAEMLNGPLCLAVPRPDLWFCKERIEACLTEATAGAERERWAVYDLPEALPAPESHAVSALRASRVGGRVTRLVIARAKWYDLVGAGFLPSLPQLTELVLELCDEPPYYNWRSEHPLSCPRLQSVCLSAPLEAGMAEDAEDIAVFAESGLAGIEALIALSLRHVQLYGDTTRLEHVFSIGR